MGMDIILSTRNSTKAEQVREIFRGSSIKISTLAERGIQGRMIEDGSTLEENAIKKALFACKHAAAGAWVMADDTGIFIDALTGAPGVRSARWAGYTATTEEIMRYTLERLRGVANRSATFKAAVALIAPDGSRYFFTGVVKGRLLEEPKTSPHPQMPYSALFIPEGETRAWAEMAPEEENRISHRGKAFREVRDFLESL